MYATARNARRTTFVVCAHQDDWQLFMGADVYRALRDPREHVVFVIATAGEGRHDDRHWRARLNGCVLSIMRALPSWNPYLADDEALPSSCTVAYALEHIAEKAVLRADVTDERAASVRIYLLHARDGRSGDGSASLAALRDESRPLAVRWPADAPPYRTWAEFVAVLEAIVRHEREPGPARVFAADPDPERNPGDHDDHRATSQALLELLPRCEGLTATWYAMYATASRPENLAGEDAADQRAAIYAYGGGYTATAAGLGDAWPQSWEREYPAFKNRQYSVKID